MVKITKKAVVLHMQSLEMTVLIQKSLEAGDNEQALVDVIKLRRILNGSGE